MFSNILTASSSTMMTCNLIEGHASLCQVIVPIRLSEINDPDCLFTYWAVSSRLIFQMRHKDALGTPQWNPCWSQYRWHHSFSLLNHSSRQSGVQVLFVSLITVFTFICLEMASKQTGFTTPQGSNCSWPACSFPNKSPFILLKMTATSFSSHWDLTLISTTTGRERWLATTLASSLNMLRRIPSNPMDLIFL